ncbi:hypothetical protein BDV96DRAFT_59540 [Lophiotrema nucula]|uniref:Uncharacterized protein n=1 Tax=Lophiotrema nucula TaxID=690887 RepID=A0A6A5Z9X2_9PLEO|nr:hypothetical protein BDV96DRAFT_59540 [Lophiotrema nucula]
MSIKRLALRTKKSLSGLYSFSNANESSSPESPGKSSLRVNENVDPTFDEFGLSHGGPSSPPTPGKNSLSPSRRKRFFGSFRKMRSSNSSPVIQPKDEPAAVPETPTRHARPSLALNFEISPPDQPMFDPTRKASSSSSIEVQHSSPITVPNSARQDLPRTETPPLAEFEVGSVPDTPAPLNRQSVQECILSHSISATQRSPKHEALEAKLGADPNPTPMPGTHLPLEELKTPDIVVTSPQPAVREVDEGYFDLPLTKIEEQSDHTSSIVASTIATSLSDAEPTVNLNPDKDPKPDPSLSPEPVPVPCPEPDPSPPNSPVPGSHAKSDDTVSKPTAISPKECRMPKLESDPYMLDAEARQSLENKTKLSYAYLAKYADAGWEQICDLQRRPSTWSRHTGLYDGTGYGEEPPANLHDLLTTACKRANNASDTTHETLVESVSTFPDTIEGEEDTKSRPQSPAVTEEQPPIDEGEALQEIIRAYAQPMLDQPMLDLEEAREEQASIHLLKRTAEEDTIAYEEKMKNEMKMSARVINRSLGG